MNQTSPALPDLPPLTGAHWRCLRLVGEVGDMAHAARRLHWSQALLKAVLAELQARVGAQHVQLADGRVLLSPTLKNLIRQHSPCPSGKSRAAAPAIGLPPPCGAAAAPAGPHGAQRATLRAAKSLAQR